MTISVWQAAIIALWACMNLNLIGCAIVGGFFAIINYNIRCLSLRPAVAGAAIADDDEEDI